MMLRIGLLAMAAVVLLSGCGDEQEQSPTEKWGEDTQAVRVKIFRDGTLTRKLALYRMNMGDYPTTEQGLDALFKRPKGVQADDWKGPYCDAQDDVEDMWGNRFKYACPGKTYPDRKDQYDLWSLGPDGTDGTEDDILNHNVK